MIYYFSSPESKKEGLEEAGVSNYLLSFAVDAKSCEKFAGGEVKNNVIIDSGAFTIWNKGGEVDIDAYRDFCLTKPQYWSFISLDVIPKTGATQKDIDICCEKGYENYLYLSKYIKNLMPVYHYGDKMKWLRTYMDHTDYIGISPANDTHEKVKRAFLKTCFDVTKADVKTHGLGYSSFEGLTMFPFYSIDSISYKKVKVFHDNKRKAFWSNKAMDFLFYERVREFLNLEKVITELWERRGVTWQ